MTSNFRNFSGDEGSRMNEFDDVAGGSRAQQQARFDEARDALEAALHEIKRVIVGQDAMLERLLVALLAGGHVLLEGVPGLAKTLTVKTLAPPPRHCSARSCGRWWTPTSPAPTPRARTGRP